MPTGVRAAETMYTGGSGGILKCVRDQTIVVAVVEEGCFKLTTSGIGRVRVMQGPVAPRHETNED